MKNCSIIDLCTPLLLNIQAYRIRFVETELPKNKRMSISEYGYNPDVKSIKMMRLNLAGEQVLYTSTEPRTSYCETISSDKLNNPFYISIWRKKNPKQYCNCFMSSFDSCSENCESNAFKIKTEYRSRLNSEQEQNIKKMGKILEKKYPEDCIDKYKESAQLASYIFKSADCIIMPSARNNKEVNITFNKEFTDNSLILDRVYFCNPFDIQHIQQNSLVFRVDKIGLVINNRVVWHKWHVKENELVDMNSNLLVHYINNTGSLIYPNINKQINDWHCGYYNNKCVKFKIEKEEEND